MLSACCAKTTSSYLSSQGGKFLSLEAKADDTFAHSWHVATSLPQLCLPDMKQTFSVIVVKNQDHVAEGNQNYLILPVHLHCLIRNWVGNVGMSGKSLALNVHWYRLPHTHTTKSPILPNMKAKRGKERIYFMVSCEHFYPSKTTLLQLVLSRADFFIRNSKTLNRFTFPKWHHLTQWHQRHAKVWKEQERGKMFTRVQQACFELSSTFSQCQITVWNNITTT